MTLETPILQIGRPTAGRISTKSLTTLPIGTGGSSQRLPNSIS
jgi:hypothetical protein